MIDQLRSLDLDFNDLFILECFKYQEDREFFDLYTIPSLKDLNLSIRFQTLKKLEYLVEDPNDTSKFILSVKGQNLIDILCMDTPDIKTQEGTAKIVIFDVGKTEDEMFEEWWKTYPTTPSWTTEDGNTKFMGSRALKNLRKADAKSRYLKLLNQGYKHDELIGSLRYEIKLKKLDSVKKKENQMEFFKGMESYLNQERYNLFIQFYREKPEFVKGEEIKSKKRNVIDI